MKGIKGGVGAVSWNSQQVKLLTPPPHPPPLSLFLSLSGSLTVCHLSGQWEQEGGKTGRLSCAFACCWLVFLLVQWQPETGYPDGIWFPSRLAGLFPPLGICFEVFLHTSLELPLQGYPRRERVWCAMPMPADLVVSDWGRPWRGATTIGAAPATTCFGKSWQSAAAVMPGSEVSDFNFVTVDLITKRWRIRKLLLLSFEFATSWSGVLCWMLKFSCYSWSFPVLIFLFGLRSSSIGSCLPNLHWQMLTHLFLISTLWVWMYCMRVRGIRPCLFFYWCSRSAGATDVCHFSWLRLPLTLFISLPLSKACTRLSGGKNGVCACACVCHALDAVCLRVRQGAMC